MAISILRDPGDQERPRWSRAHMAAREALRALQHADAYLEKAHQLTGDEMVAHRVERARREIKEALRRADTVLKDVDLREADQKDLGLEDAP